MKAVLPNYFRGVDVVLVLCNINLVTEENKKIIIRRWLESARLHCNEGN